MLTVFRYADLAVSPPPGLEEALRDLNAPVEGLLTHLTRRRYGRLTPRGQQLVTLATRDAPMGMVRALIGDPIPTSLDIPIRAACDALARLEDA